MSENNDTIKLLQYFSISNVAVLNIIRDSMTDATTIGSRMDEKTVNIDSIDKSDVIDDRKATFKTRDPLQLSKSEQKKYDSLIKAIDIYTNDIKQTDSDFVPQIIKKIFSLIKKDNIQEYILNHDSQLFNIRNDQNKLVTIFMGVNLKYGYQYLTNSIDIRKFWQYLSFVVVSCFDLISDSNDKIKTSKKYTKLNETIRELRLRIKKSGIMFDDNILNPYIGFEEDEEFSVDSLSKNMDIQIKNNDLSLNFILKSFGITDNLDLDNNLILSPKKNLIVQQIKL